MRPWKLLLGIAAALVLAAGGFFAWVKAVEARRWAELERLARELIEEGRGRDPRRPTRGVPRPGNAWEDYDLALAAVAGMRTSDLAEYVTRGPKADRAKVEALLAAGEGWRVGLAAGAGKELGARAIRYEGGFDANPAGLLRSQNLVHLAVGKSRFLRDEGKEAEATELLLDALCFAADRGRNALLIDEMISLALLGTLLEELRDGARKDVPRPEAERALALLDASWPFRGEGFLNEAATALGGVTGSGGERELAVSRLQGWRYGFSSRIMTADFLESYAALMRRSAAAARASWREVERESNARKAEVAALRNPLSRALMPSFAGAYKAAFVRRAQLRLLRMSLDPSLSLEDPFGGPLRRDGNKVWSVGPDGIDDGGTLDDIVLELK